MISDDDLIQDLAMLVVKAEAEAKRLDLMNDEFQADCLKWQTAAGEAEARVKELEAAASRDIQAKLAITATNQALVARVAVLREALKHYHRRLSDVAEGDPARIALATLDPAADKLTRELEALRKVAETALAYDQRRGPKGQLGSADETMALRDAHRAALAAWRQVAE